MCPKPECYLAQLLVIQLRFSPGNRSILSRCFRGSLFQMRSCVIEDLVQQQNFSGRALRATLGETAVFFLRCRLSPVSWG